MCVCALCVCTICLCVSVRMCVSVCLCFSVCMLLLSFPNECLPQKLAKEFLIDLNARYAIQSPSHLDTRSP